MIDLFVIKAGLVLLATAIAAYTDWKTGYIHDWITYPFIGVGVIIAFIEGTIINAAIIAGLIFLFGMLVYYSGKIGGGDIKLLTGIPFYFAMYNNYPFVLIVLILSTFFALIFYGFDNMFFLARKPPENFLSNVLFVFVISFFVGLFFRKEFYLALFFFVLSAFSLVSLIFKDYITKSRYKKEIKVKELLNDDLADLTFMNKGNMVPLDDKLFNQIKEKLKGEDKIFVYRDLPKFGPFIFLGVVATLLLLHYVPILSFAI